jgi:tetratricopeptide (TPR) repeat protein
LEYAVQASPNDARAPYYLGCLWYHLRQPEKAIEMWRCSLDRNSSYATAWRNLGLACFNKLRDADQAWTAYNKAFALDESDARVLYELDQLAKRLGHSSTDRLAKLEDHRSLVDQRDDLYIEYVTLLNLQGKHREALDAVLARRFHPWEGGEGKASGQFVLAITSLARSALGQGRWQEAIELLRQTERWPESLGEGKIAGIQENDSHYLLGLAHSLAGDSAEATEFFQRASQGRREPTAAMYYNDQPPEMIFYQGLACRQLGREDEATARFQKLVEYGKHHLADEPEIDFFAVSLPDFLVFEDSLARRNRIHCHFMMALGAAGLGNTAASESHFQKLARLDPSHVGACLYPRWHDQ